MEHIKKEEPMYDSYAKTAFVAEFDHLSSEDYKKAYEPSEDTFLMIDTIYYDESYLCSHNPKVCLEIGVGCGFVITSLCSLLSPHFPSCKFYGADINSDAIKTAQKTVDKYGFTDSIKLEQANIVPKTLTGNKVDVIVFNPVNSS